MILFIVINAVIILADVLFLEEYEWIGVFFNEVEELGMFLCIGWTFRLRSVNIYYRLEASDVPEYYQDYENSPPQTAQTSPTPQAVEMTTLQTSQ